MWVIEVVQLDAMSRISEHGTRALSYLRWQYGVFE